MKRNISYLLLLFYLLSNLSLSAQNQNFSCGVNDKVLPEKTLKAMRMAPEWLAEKKMRKTADLQYVCYIGIDIDSDTYSYFDKDTARIMYEVLKTIEKVSKIYEAEINTQLIVTKISIWKDKNTDPYFGISDIFQLLNITINTWTNPPFRNLGIDKVMYLSTKYFTGAGGVASGFANVSPWGNVSVIAHELGHNFGSPHTQSCYWPGGPLDFCYAAEGDCYQNTLEAIRGTIMSYCQSELTFHPLCQALMQNDAENQLKKLAKIETPPILPETIMHDGNPFILFNPVLFAEDYYYELSQTADFKEILLADSSYINAVPYQFFKKNTIYYLRIKARNRFGESAWSNVSGIIINNNVLTAPVLKIPDGIVNNNGNLFIDPDYTHEMPFELDNDASDYEVKIYPPSDNYKLVYLEQNRAYSRDQKFFFRPSDSQLFNGFFWRVRAVKGGAPGPWSELQKLNFIQKDNSIPLPFYDSDNAPLSFPITYIWNEEAYDVRFTLSVNSDFTNPVMEKLVKTDKYSRSTYNSYSVMSGQLMPNTRYFLKVTTIPPVPDLAYGSSGPVFRVTTRTFKTGSTDMSEKHQFFKHDNTPNLGRAINKFLYGNKGILINSEHGISRIDVGTLETELFTRDKTNGLVSNNLSAMSVDSLGNLWAIFPTSSRNGGYDGAFPKPVYVLRQFDGESMALIKSQEFVIGGNNSYFTGIDGNSQLIATDKGISTITNGVLNLLINMENQFMISNIISSKSYIWINGMEYKSGLWSVKRYNKNTREINSIAVYNIQTIAADKKENLWVSFNNRSAIGKYDGNNWTIYDENNSPIRGNGIELYLDKFDNVYVRSNSENTLYRFNGKNWETLLSFSKLAINTFLVDELGKIWAIVSDNTLLRVDPCKQISKPNIISSSSTTESEKPILLEARGCNSVVWNWQSKDENVTEKLVSGTNKIEVTPKNTTTYRAQCYENGCSGEESIFTVSFNVLRANKVVKDQICQGDSVSVKPQIDGDFDAGNQLSAILYSSAKTFRIPLKAEKDAFAFKTDNTIPGGKYWLKVSSSSPEIVSKDSVEINILPAPTVGISGRNNVCAAEKISLFAQVSGGTSPYSYEWKQDAYPIRIDNDTISGIDQASIYSLTVTDSKGCISLITSHILTKTDLSNINLNADGPTELLHNASVTLSVPSGYSYQWYRNNAAIAGASNYAYVVTEEGNYKVIVSSKDCSVEKTISIGSITANEPNESLEVNLNAFPNPSGGNFIVEFMLKDSKQAELNIFDISGKTIWQKTVRGRGTHTEQVNLSKYPAGTYLLVMQKERLKKTIKLEKQ